MNNIIIIIGTVAAVVVAIITAMLIAGCFLFGRKQGEENRRDIRNIRNAAYQSDNRYIRELPPVPEYDVGYQLPIECLQHGSPIDALNMYDNPSNEVPDESPYVIMPEELLSKRSYSEIA
ncbi:Hypothetical predicted protein [Paramuricea clavata]|uniref:Uncharacterized protein n=1 Tax=Paramuricea clavata TaxID=317549 RepID=A0A7D9J0Q6_PARCT|nr:Hypothetical predicted protein [Paramuricea clavata]